MFYFRLKRCKTLILESTSSSEVWRNMVRSHFISLEFHAAHVCECLARVRTRVEQVGVQSISEQRAVTAHRAPGRLSEEPRVLEEPGGGRCCEQRRVSPGGRGDGSGCCAGR